MKKIIVILLLSIFSLSSYSQNIKKLGFIFDSKIYNFGDIEQYNNQAAIFTFTNKTKHPVTILPIFNENDLEVSIPEKPILVGETILIKAKYYTAGKGPFNRKFNLYFGSLNKPVELRIVGNIKSLSPEAYINCPMSRPELAKAKIELVGDVAEIETEIPLSGVTIEIIGRQNNKEITLFSSSKGKFGTKLPVGNYQIILKHPNYHSYIGPFYIGQTSPPLRVRLTPIAEEPLLAQNNVSKENDIRNKENYYSIETKNNDIANSEKQKEPEKIEISSEKTSDKNEPKKNNGLDRNIGYVKNEPKDNLYSSKNNDNEVPNTLTTYKESNDNIEPDDKTSETFDSKEEEYPKYVTENKPNEENLDDNRIYDNKPAKETNKTEDKPNKETVYKPVKDKEKTINPIIATNKYTFRVIDEKTLEPIFNAFIFVTDLYNKKNKHKDRTNERGYSEMEIAKNDYRFIASADGYISNEIRILKDDKSDIYRIMLSPISDLFDEIYEAKKAKQKEDDVLDKLSYGKTKLSFQNDELEIKDDKDLEIVKTETNNSEIEQKRKEDSLKIVAIDLELEKKRKEDDLEKIAQEEQEKRIKEKEDSLHKVTELLALEILEKEKKLKKIENDRIAELKKQREKEKLDSLNNFIAQLQEKNNKLENDLDKVSIEKDHLEKQKREKEIFENIKVQEQKVETEDEPILSKSKYAANNIIFLIDISTSMGKEHKMEMLKKSIINLTKVLRDIDRVAIITYNQRINIVLESISGNNTTDIISAIDSLKTGGLTNGVRGITSAYEMLEYYYIPNGNNQIILATDGLFSKYNNELTENELNRLVKKQAAKNMKLTVVGFGKDEEGKDLMTKLAKNGSGQFIQIKNEWMTNDILIKEIQLNSKK